MKAVRADRVGEAMMAELANLIHREVKDPRVGFVSVTRVEVSRDLAKAKVYFSVLAADQEESTRQGLVSAGPFLRGEVARRLKLRLAPALEFHVDRSIQHSVAIQAMLRDVDPPR